ncbi:hypothetical protein ACFL35_05280 [Candidatus Riflebacteria bacterium]
MFEFFFPDEVQSEEERKILNELEIHNNRIDELLDQIEEYILNGYKLNSLTIRGLQRKIQLLENKSSFWRSKLSNYI